VYYVVVFENQKGNSSLYPFYGGDFKVEFPTGSGNRMLLELANEIARRLASMFLRNPGGKRPALEARRGFRMIRTGGTTFCSMSASTATMARV